MTDSEPEPKPDNLQQINRRARSALRNHHKYKHYDNCILFMDGMALWRDGKIQIGDVKYNMTRRTMRVVKHEYRKINGQDILRQILVNAGPRLLFMVSLITGLIYLGGHWQKQNQSYQNEKSKPNYNNIKCFASKGEFSNILHLMDTVHKVH